MTGVKKIISLIAITISLAMSVTASACFTGNYPVHFEDEDHTRQLHLFDAMNR